MEWIDNQTAADSNKPWFVYTSMISPHPPNWVPEGPWTKIYDDVTLPPLNYKKGNIGMGGA